MTLVRPEFEVGDRVRVIGEHAWATWFYGDIIRISKSTNNIQVEVKGTKLWLPREGLQVHHRDGDPGPPYIKLLKEVRFEGLGEIIICPPRACLRIIQEDAHGVWVEVEEAAGSFYFWKNDKRAVWATHDDLVNEPEYNDYETINA